MIFMKCKKKNLLTLRRVLSLFYDISKKVKVVST